MNNKRLITALAASLLWCVPSGAVFNERDLSQTLSVLKFELSQEVGKSESRSGRIDSKDHSQHMEMIQLTKRCNELALMLYSQDQDYTFDMTYALEEVTREYESFNERRFPFDDIISRLNSEIDRYSRLLESLRRLPPQLREIKDLPDSLAYHNDSLRLDVFPPVMAGRMPSPPEGFRRPDSQKPEAVFHGPDGRVFRLDSLNANGHKMAFFLDRQGQADRDSCIRYATTLLKMYSFAKDRIVADSEHYEDANLRLKESYDYAHERYQALQKRMMTHNQDTFFAVLTHLRSYVQRAIDDSTRKYARRSALDGSVSHSEWRGPMVTGLVFFVLLAVVFAIALSVLLIRGLGRVVKSFRSEGFISRRKAVTTACGLFIFAVAVLVVSLMSSNPFFCIASKILLTISLVMLGIIVSMLLRVPSDRVSAAIKILSPVFFAGIVVFACRVMFLPNRMLSILLPPLMLVAALWQLRCCRRAADGSDRFDSVLSWVSLVVLGACAVMSWLGYEFLCIIVAGWWLFQVFTAEVLGAFLVLISRYGRTVLSRKLEAYKGSHPDELPAPADGKGEYIKVTWAYDLVRMVLFPVLCVMSLPLCVRYALGTFNMTEICNTLFNAPFFNLADKSGAVILHVSVHKMVVVTVMFFIFKYLSYFIKSFYRILKLESLRVRSGRRHIHTNEVNLTLADNIIAILVWGIYIVTVILLLKIPVGALSIVAAGLATGIGLAMKDILNNFIYGIQLMSGRLRVGDWIVCEGVRGRVSAISYQSTQIECEDGSVMSFLNTTLFNNNFKNLTRNNSYEYVKIIVGVPYGADIDRIRTILLEAVRPEQKKDAYGRDIVDLNKGVSVILDDFGESAIGIAIKQHVLVTERWGYIARVKEIIYNVFNANGISIPFNQLDIHVVSGE